MAFYSSSTSSGASDSETDLDLYANSSQSSVISEPEIGSVDAQSLGDLLEDTDASSAENCDDDDGLYSSADATEDLLGDLDVFAHAIDEDTLLFPGSPVTLLVSLVMIMKYALR